MPTNEHIGYISKVPYYCTYQAKSNAWTASPLNICSRALCAPPYHPPFRVHTNTNHLATNLHLYKLSCTHTPLPHLDFPLLAQMHTCRVHAIYNIDEILVLLYSRMQRKLSHTGD